MAAARRQLACELARRGAEVWIADLREAIGVNDCDDYLFQFGVPRLAEVLQHAHRYDWRSQLIRSDTTGKILGILANGITALRSAREWSGALAFDEFALTVSAIRPTPWSYAGKWDEQCDRLLADWFQHHGVRLNDNEVSKAAETVARDQSFHPVRDYLNELKWDKTSRIDDRLTLYLGIDPTDFSRAVGAKWLISAVARVYAPGCKADHILIVEGPQGSLKSTAFRVLGDPWFTDDIADLGNKDSQMATIGTWIIELVSFPAARGRAAFICPLATKETLSMNNAQSDAGAPGIYDKSAFTPGSSMEERVADLLDQQNDLLRKIADVLEKFAIGYRVLMSVENRVEDIEKWRQTALMGRGWTAL